MAQSQLPKEAQEKLNKIKKSVEKFSKEIQKNHKEVMGVALFPPDKEKKDQINVFILLDLAKEKNPLLVRDKVFLSSKKIAEKIDKNLFVKLMDLWELRENCFDAKYEILQNIAQCAIFYDRTDLLAALKISEVHKSMVIKKFEKYIVAYVAVGSLFRGDATSNDIDVAVVVDDTDVKKMTRLELRDRLMDIMRSYGREASAITGVKKQFHIQTYILTDFWDAIKDANPVIYTFLRDGVPIFDRGVFMPWKLLLRMGRVKPSPEAIDMQMDTGYRLIKRTKGKLLSIIGEDLYYAVLNPAQAALMLYGMAPPTPKETIDLLDEIFVKKEKLLDKKYVTLLKDIRNLYKDLEHGKLKEVKGVEIDKFLSQTETYLKGIEQLFVKIQKRKDKQTVEDLNQACNQIVKDVLEVSKVKITTKSNLTNLYKKQIIEKNILPKKMSEIYKTVLDLKKDYAKKKVSPQEIEKVRKEVNIFLKSNVSYIQRKRGYELERAKIRFKYGDQYGELLLLDKVAFLNEDLDSKDPSLSKAIVKQDGSLSNLKKTDIMDFEKHISKVKIPEKVFIKEKTFEDLRKLFGKDVEILINY